MIGNNKLFLNNATMCEAIQFWLDDKTVAPIAKVVSVTNRDTMFEISLSEDKT